ncbi:NAD(P)-dependent dehydrogenase, short-chain alcohol dehydrogenase family [Chitinophaga eiseniae]|uniref:NAD(P)-dependent dehydrogenase, short-chain alcohol dehydrogenase family n=1 Tax=Chitinophaga eiseniae TaxID=634771 RepID=A0A1T4TUE3_9BACT|nr:SDR family NAD(P)-dependent oxidoreductase [Chitinophaga eiseniae]SKA43948.1 NAD(P)-dependent dehydrogenase, short-chain alcohol dehydrogenase family [Chitinophaga eiseniae]
MDLQLASKRAFISGSTQGIGFAIAQYLAQEGAAIIIHGRTQAKVDKTVKRLSDSFPGAVVMGIAADLAVREETEALLQQLPPVDILVNNAGIFEVKDFMDIGDDSWHNFFNVNVMSAVRLSRQVLQGMLSRNWGRIIFISSESGLNVPGNMIHYGTTKAAMLALGNGLSKLTKGTRVTVNTILGGPAYSDGVATVVEQIAASHQQSAEAIRQQIMQSANPHSLLERFIDPAEIASLAAYLASPLSSAINGASIRADGGVLRTL